MMSNTNKKLESLKKQYEGARINEEHSKWTMEGASSYDRVFNRGSLIHESDLRDKYHEEARQAAVQITALVGLENSTQILHYIDLDVERYMERRKSEYNKTPAKPVERTSLQRLERASLWTISWNGARAILISTLINFLLWLTISITLDRLGMQNMAIFPTVFRHISIIGGTIFYAVISRFMSIATTNRTFVIASVLRYAVLVLLVPLANVAISGHSLQNFITPFIAIISIPTFLFNLSISSPTWSAIISWLISLITSAVTIRCLTSKSQAPNWWR